jgi:hypothetical protein
MKKYTAGIIYEKDVLKAVKQVLEIYNIPYIRNNSGSIKSESGRWISFGKKGSADIVGIITMGRLKGHFLAIEVKRPNGGILSEAQKEWLDKVNELGGVGIVVDGVDGLLEHLRDRGVIR